MSRESGGSGHEEDPGPGDYGGLRQKTDTRVGEAWSACRGGPAWCKLAHISGAARPIVFRSEVSECRSGWAYVIGVADSMARLMVSPGESHPVQ